MKCIGLLSDTHGYFNERLYRFFDKVDEIWHAGDIGDIKTADTIAAFKPLRAVYGNIDGQDVRTVYPEHNHFSIENLDVWIIHIGGYPGRYSRNVTPEIYKNAPDLFICGHSHILKIIYDKKLNFLHINPGAAGKKGFHKLCTAVRFTIDNKNIANLEVWQIPRTQ